MQLTRLLALPIVVVLALAWGPVVGGSNHANSYLDHLSQREPAETKNFTFNQLYELQKSFLDNFLYPKNAIQAKAINSTLFADNVQGRVDITRTFLGRELNTEYLFGLFANIATNKDEFTLLGFPTSYEITHFAASQNIASASTRFNFSFPILKGLSVPLQIDTWNVFNAQGQISQYDATFKWWQWTVDYLLQFAAAATNQTLPNVEKFVVQSLAKSICLTAQTYCNGTNAQYTSQNDCLTFLQTETRLGEAYELGRNTLLCRMVHQNMVPFRPSVHCPHIGRTGGGYCNDDKSYVDTVNQNYFTNFPFGYTPNGPIKSS